MKHCFKILTFFIISSLCTSSFVMAQSAKDDVFFRAMKDELARSTTQLTLDKYKPPFYLSYQISDIKTMVIKATLGSIVQSQQNENRSNYLRLMVGNYVLNDENFSGSTSTGSASTYLPMPIESDYAAIRRAFWGMTDQVYKSALNNYERKLTALKQQNNNTEKLDDYSRIIPVTKIMNEVPFNYSKAKWEDVARSLSVTFKDYKDIMSSSVNTYFINNTIYYTTNEGTTLKYPVTLAILSVTAEVQADDGEPLSDYLLYYAPTPEQLPAADKIKQDIKLMTANLEALRKAPVIQDAYSGPVIFEDEAAATVFTTLFSTDGLIASREPVSAYAGPSTSSVSKLENKINQRVCPENINIRAVPRTKSFNNVPLVGTFDIDAEGVAPKDELPLVEKGILKTLLNNRVPTRKVKESNGYCRLDLFRSGPGKAPGVIDIAYNNGNSLKTLRKDVLKQARKDGLDFIYVVRKFDTNAEMPYMGGNSCTKPIAIYSVSTKTGDEQLVRSAFLGDIQVTDFKKIIGGTQEQFVYNTLISGGGCTAPASFITPKAIVFSDISIEKDNGTQPKKPVVPNPLAEEK